VAETRRSTLKAEMCNIPELLVYKAQNLCTEDWTVVQKENDEFDVIEMTQERRKVSAGLPFRCCE
jgi:hypothetical protein